MTTRKIVVLGANGAMGSGSAAVFASAGIPTVLLARTHDRATAARERVAKLLGDDRANLAPIQIGTYADDLARAVSDADVVFECVAEDLETKRAVYGLIERVRDPGSIVATVTSGLSVAALCDGRSDSFRTHFLGVHLFNPPMAITGCELIAHVETDPEVVARVRELLAHIGRVVVECADTPAFAGNRIGFKVLNEIAQLAEHHGVARVEQLFGSHTGRALAPLATIDLVGWDVHKAIVDNLHANTRDEARDAFALPAYMLRGIERGHLGRKTRDKGGFFRVDGKGKDARSFVVDPNTGDYHPLVDVMPLPPAFVERMKAAIRAGHPEDALDALFCADGSDAELVRRVVLGYISYALGRVGEVVARPSDVDRIMAFGFHWAPPTMLVDAIGAKRTLAMLERVSLAVPPVVEAAARTGAKLFAEGIDPARFFTVAA